MTRFRKVRLNKDPDHLQKLYSPVFLKTIGHMTAWKVGIHGVKVGLSTLGHVLLLDALPEEAGRRWIWTETLPKPECFEGDFSGDPGRILVA